MKYNKLLYVLSFAVLNSPEQLEAKTNPFICTGCSPFELTDDGKKMVKEVSDIFKSKDKEFLSAIFNIKGKIRKITLAT